MIRLYDGTPSNFHLEWFWLASGALPCADIAGGLGELEASRLYEQRERGLVGVHEAGLIMIVYLDGLSLKLIWGGDVKTVRY